MLLLGWGRGEVEVLGELGVGHVRVHVKTLGVGLTWLRVVGNDVLDGGLEVGLSNILGELGIWALESVLLVESGPHLLEDGVGNWLITGKVFSKLGVEIGLDSGEETSNGCKRFLEHS